MVIDFTATWCGPCKSMEPAIKEFVAKYTEVEFIKIDVDKFTVILFSFFRLRKIYDELKEIVSKKVLNQFP